MSDNFQILATKINGFIRKYYRNQMLKGLIFSVAIVLVLFLLADAIEYFAWTSILTRTIIYYSFLGLTVLVLFYYILVPLFKLARISHSLPHNEAAKIIGKHFPEVSDKLLNTIQLHQQHESQIEKGDLDLLMAGIDQKSAELTPIPFKRAIDMKKNIGHLRYVVPSLLIILVILIIAPSFITEPSRRLVNHNVSYEKPLPYQLIVLNEKLEALQHDDFTLNVEAIGEEIPSQVWLTDGTYKFKLTAIKPGKFEYTFNDINSETYFHLLTDDFKSEQYHLTVFPKPLIFSFDIVLDYPGYLNRKDELIENSGDLVVPEGTNIQWKIFTKDTRKVMFKQEAVENTLLPFETNVFVHRQKAENNFYYTLYAENEFVKGLDSMTFSVQVIKDEYPTINVQELQDKTLYGYAFFNGAIGDDYGFRSLKFFHKKDGTSDNSWNSEIIRIDNDIPQQRFSYSLQALDFDLQPGESLSYYFEVRDNDAINGFKRSKSAIFSLYLPDVSEIEDELAEASEKIKDKIKETLEQLEKINQQLEEARLSLLEKRELSWMDKQQLNELIEKQKKLEEQVGQMKKLNDEVNELEDLIQKKNDEELQEKIDQLEEMFEELVNEELLEQLEEISEIMENLDKDQLNEFLEKMQKSNQDLKTNLEQNLELYKQLEFEQKLKETIEKLDKLGDEQLDLSEKTGEKEIPEEQSLSEQENINEQFSEIEKDLKETEDLNEALEQSFDMNIDPQDMENINEDLNEATSELQKGKQKKAEPSQSQAGKKMKETASKLGMMLQSAKQARMGEDIEKIRKMLDNLLDLSFKQEALMDVVKETSKNDPKYVDNTDQLKLIKDDFKIVHDSLVALSKRQMMIRPFVIGESEKINNYIDRAIQSLQERKTGKALSEQQYSMTSMNNLALMLAESLEQMQSSMMMPGMMKGEACPNPGQGQPSPSPMEGIMQMQQQMNQGMQQKGKEQGMGEGGGGINGQSEELARMAAMQAEIRRRLQQYLDETKSNQGQGNSMNKLIEEMKKTEDDIINRRITQETLERQKQIEVRLLKSENARLEREKEKKRESKEGKSRNTGNQNIDLKYNTKSDIQEEILITAPIEMSPYYRELLKKYIYKLEKENGSQ